MTTEPRMSDSDLINLLGAFAFALQAAMPRSQQERFRSTLGSVAQQARLQEMPAVAAVLDQIQATLPPTEDALESGTSEPKH
jgi:hypothetical protein